MDKKEALRQQRTKELRDFFSQPKVWVFIVVGLIVLYLALGPIPVKVDKTLPYYASYEKQVETGTIHIQGTVSHYLIKQDRFKGRIWTDTGEVTIEAKCDAFTYSDWTQMICRSCKGEGSEEFLAFFDPDKNNPLYYDKYFSRIYFMRGKGDYLAAPASTEEEAIQWREDSAPYLH